MLLIWNLNAHKFVGQVSIELMDRLGGLQLALALGQGSEELLELRVQGLLLGLKLGLVLPAAVFPDSLLELVQLPAAVTYLVLCHLVQGDIMRGKDKWPFKSLIKIWRILFRQES